MIRTKKKFRRFDTSDATAMNNYESLINDPLCVVTDKENVTETNKVFDSEGKLAEITQRIVYLLHWEERDF